MSWNFLVCFAPLRLCVENNHDRQSKESRDFADDDHGRRGLAADGEADRAADQLGLDAGHGRLRRVDVRNDGLRQAELRAGSVLFGVQLAVGAEATEVVVGRDGSSGAGHRRGSLAVDRSVEESPCP